MELAHAYLVKELCENANEVSKANIFVGHNSFNLVKFGQMSSVYCLISEHPVNREQFSWLELAALHCFFA